MRKSDTGLPIVIAGGGIAGLAAALGLARIGASPLILEQSANLGEVGAGLQVGPNAAKALQWLGAWEHVEHYAFAPRAIRIFDGMTGRALLTIPLGASFARRFGAPYRVIHRADLLLALFSAVREEGLIGIQTAAQVAEIGGERGSVVTTLLDGDTLRSAAVIGADGIRSTVRRLLPRQGRAAFRGFTLYRALIATEAMPNELVDDTVSLWLCRGGHIVHYPVRSGRAMNIVVATESPWTSERWSEPCLRNELEPLFSKTCTALRSLMHHPIIWSKWAGADLEPEPVWSRGLVTLIGDAAHASLPFLAQGAAMALEDAVVLARTLRRNRIADGFDLYAKIRFPRTKRLTIASRKAGQFYHLSGMRRHLRNAILRASSPDRFLNRMAWIYGYDPLAS